MELFDTELDEARAGLTAKGIDPADFSFERVFLPPESDDGAMFTIRYEVRITRASTGKAMTTVGGIGLDWVGDFQDALDDGDFA